MTKKNLNTMKTLNFVKDLKTDKNSMIPKPSGNLYKMKVPIRLKNKKKRNQKANQKMKNQRALVHVHQTLIQT